MLFVFISHPFGTEFNKLLLTSELQFAHVQKKVIRTKLVKFHNFTYYWMSHHASCVMSIFMCESVVYIVECTWEGIHFNKFKQI